MSVTRIKTVRLSAGKITTQTEHPDDFGLGGRLDPQTADRRAVGAPFILPGPGADLNREGEEQEETVFGVDWRSNVPGPVKWTLSLIHI